MLIQITREHKKKTQTESSTELAETTPFFFFQNKHGMKNRILNANIIAI